MKLERFKVERWMDEYEGFFDLRPGRNLYRLFGSRGVIGTLWKRSGRISVRAERERLVYGHIHGSPELKKGIAGLYRDLTPEDVVPTHGGISANHMVIATLVDRGR